MTWLLTLLACTDTPVWSTPDWPTTDWSTFVWEPTAPETSDVVPPIAATLAYDAIDWPVLGPEPLDAELVKVSAPRELRGLWVATVSNLDFPSRVGLSDAAMKRELEHLVDRSAEIGFNTLVFQVRPEGDALYASSIEPWSRFLLGRQGKGPGFDPLEHLIARAHARGIEVHAWFNPYRASSAKGAAVADNHVSKWGKDAVRPWGRVLWLDPGDTEIQQHALKVVQDVLRRYEIDGIHLDDYFYPYPEGRQQFADDPTYQAYKKRGGMLDRAMWRRDNVDSLVKRLSEACRKDRPDVRFGISPFGIYRPGKPAGVRGLDQVAELNADPLKWFESGWVDYLAPQLYWPTTAKAQRYDALLSWWDEQVTPERPLLVGLDLTKVGKDKQWTLAELRTQVQLSRQQKQTAGHIWFRATPVLKNQAGVADLLSELYAKPALPPPLPRDVSAPAAPRVRIEGTTVKVLDRPRDRKVLVLYRASANGFDLQQILGPDTEEIGVAPGTWALSSVTRSGEESLGAKLVVGTLDDAVADGQR